MVPEAPFYIPMTGPAASRGARSSMTTLSSCLTATAILALPPAAGRPVQRRHPVSRPARAVLDDVQPLLLGSNLRDDNSALTVDLTNPDVYRNGRIVLQKDILHIVRTIFLWRERPTSASVCRITARLPPAST